RDRKVSAARRRVSIFRRWRRRPIHPPNHSMTKLAAQSTGAPQQVESGSDGRGTLTLSRRARRVASACRALVTARARLRLRSRPETLGVRYVLETGGPGGAERMLLDLAGNVGPGWQAVIGVMKTGWLRSQATSAGLPCVMVDG